jgi:hypothetical protein
MNPSFISTNRDETVGGVGVNNANAIGCSRVGPIPDAEIVTFPAQNRDGKIKIANA